MLEDLEPIGLVELARRLDTDPFEVMRLLVVADALSASTKDRRGETSAPLLFAPEMVDRLRAVGKVDEPWWPGVALPKDPSPGVARVRAAVALLLDRGAVGEDQARLDNVWRGLEPRERRLLETAFEALQSDGMLQVSPSPIGPMVSVPTLRASSARDFADGKAQIPALTAQLAEV